MAAKKKQAPAEQKFYIKYETIIAVEARNANEAFATADEILIGMFESDENDLDDIFAISKEEMRVHDFTELEECTCGIDDEEDDEDEGDLDPDEDDEGDGDEDDE